MRILGIDYGDKRIGLALADKNSIALPYKILPNIDRQQILTELDNIIKQENIDQVVVGLPHSLSGKTNERLDITQRFVDWLEKSLVIPVDTVDERYTSQFYERQGIKKDIDKYAASAILETWLEKNK